MHKCIAALIGLIFASVAGASASAETVRYPTTGNPALMISIPQGWVRTPTAAGNRLQTFVVTSPHHVEVASIILPNLGTAEEFAKKVSAFSRLTMLNSGPTKLLGFPGFMFDASYTDKTGAMKNMHVVQAKLDKAHLVLIEIRSPSKGTNVSELGEGKQILETLKLAPTIL